MTALLATCAAIVAAVASAPEGATIRLTEDCPAGMQAVVWRRTTPLTIDASGRLLPAGLWIVQSEHVTWRGGTIHAPGGERGFSRHGYAVTSEMSANIRIEGAVLTNAFRGFVTIRPRGRQELVGNIIQGVGGDGINFAGDPLVGPVSGLIVGNLFRDIRTRRDLGDHPDCIQLWGAVDGVEIRDNRIVNGADCQGITTFGGRTDPIYRNIRVTGNWLHLADPEPNGIALGNCADCEVTGNVLFGERAYVRTYGTVERLRLCGNVVQRPRPPHVPPEAWGALPCEAATQEPVAPVVRVIAPPQVRVVVERPE